MTQQETDQAIKNQIGTDPVATLPSNPDIASALANYRNSASVAAAALNSSLQSNYLSSFKDWSIGVTAGHTPNTNPPQPPNAYIAALASDGWAYVIRGTQPVCPVPPIPAVSTQPSTWFHIDYVMDVPAGDVMPIGFVLTMPDGTKWQKSSSPTPAGTAYFYAKIS